MKTKALSILLLLAITGCKSATREPVTIICDPAPEPVEIVSLKDVERIKNLDGKWVQLEGYLHTNFEDVAIYPAQHAPSKEAIWLGCEFGNIPSQKLDSLHDKKVQIIGRLNLKDKGHWEFYLGALDSIKCLKVF
ncbi:hypothetical protein HHL16_20845 [Pseudoflavitalea sp. G-6-1-2]|uniref:hypothetical protein n=1 Tax=Pseudoflavitalea sp. G-6-1-2 TaxID=2728841 RepID=UPI001469B7C5|nr:hypothetical protein [Pseudoflavitalea sp. G-6-1-2]NML23340.1 hypothetical protein [Pseudoflavitalea sp. G-6-1-2]